MSPGLFAATHRAKMEQFAGIPGPEPSFPMGTAMDFVHGGQPWEVCARYADEYGPLTLIWLMGEPALVLHDPDLIGQVLETDWQSYYKDDPCNALEPVITAGSLFICNHGHGWREARRQNPLSMDGLDVWLEDQVVPLAGVLARGVESFKGQSEPVDLYWDMQRLTFRAFALTFWGRELDEEHFERFQTLARMGDKRMQSKLPLVPPIDPSFHLAKHEWYSEFEQLVAEARLSPNPHGVDLLNVTLNRGTELNDAQLAEALATNFFGGVFSGSSTINTALYLLDKHPDEMQRLRIAVREAAGSDRDIDWPAVLACQALDFVTREAMRFYPAVPIYFRNSSTTETVKLGEHTLPPNTQLFISNWWLHRFSPHWDQPEQFRPARWDNGVAEQNPLGSGYFFPFGRGPRACIGQPFAMLYIKLALASILLNASVSLEAGQEYRQSFFFGVMMPQDLMARFKAV